jgi:homopolymeric O-antigen transport system permease protein
MAAAASSHDSLFVLYNLIGKDFKVRYRNMSLGIFWSLLNPLIMMGVLTFVFTVVQGQTEIEYYPLFVLIGYVPFNFFTMAWASGTNSIVDNSALIKKIPFRRELVPLSVVLANTLHYLIQLALVLAAVALFVGVNRYWLWIPVVMALQVVFVCGAALACSALDVYYRDIRYVVESANLVLFWLVGIFYSIDRVPSSFSWLYESNPVAAVIVIARRVLLHGASPGTALSLNWFELGTLWKLTLVSFGTLAAGLWIFRRIQKDFSDCL